MELNKKSFPLEAQFTDLGPVEGIDFCVTLNQNENDQMLAKVSEKQSTKQNSVVGI